MYCKLGIFPLLCIRSVLESNSYWVCLPGTIHLCAASTFLCASNETVRMFNSDLRAFLEVSTIQEPVPVSQVLDSFSNWSKSDGYVSYTMVSIFLTDIGIININNRELIHLILTFQNLKINAMGKYKINHVNGHHFMPKHNGEVRNSMLNMVVPVGHLIMTLQLRDQRPMTDLFFL